MKKALVASVVVLVSASSSFAALGTVIQGQEWGLGLGSVVTFTTGQGEATTNQHLNLFDSQMAGNVGLGTWGSQMAAGNITETATVAGDNIVGSAVQSIAVDGSVAGGFGQAQNILPAGGIIAQSQGVGVLAKQDLIKAGGPGEVEGTHTVGMMMAGSGESICSNMCNLSTICGAQESSVAGGPCSTGTVSTTMTAATAQMQQVN